MSAVAYSCLLGKGHWEVVTVLEEGELVSAASVGWSGCEVQLDVVRVVF